MKILFLLLMMMSPLADNNKVDSTQATVYICTGPQSKRYHKTARCRGLNSCSEDIKAVSLDYARSIGRTPCGWCYK